MEIPVTDDGQNLLASGGSDGTVRLWDPRTAQQLNAMKGHRDLVNALCAITVDGQNLLASSGYDRTVRLWDPRTGIYRATVPTDHPALALTPLDGSLAIGLSTGVLVIKLNADA